MPLSRMLPAVATSTTGIAIAIAAAAAAAAARTHSTLTSPDPQRSTRIGKADRAILGHQRRRLPA